MVAIGVAGASLAAGGPPSIASDNEQYTAGQTVQLTGQNWQAGEAVHVVVDDAGGDPWTHAADLTAAADGTVADSFPLPETVTGAFTVTATAPSGSATTTFTVSAPPPPLAAPTISSDKGNYLPGATVQLTGANWTPGSTVHVVVDDDKNDPWSHTADVIAAADRTIADSFPLPTGLVANFTVTATGALGQTAGATFTVALVAQPTIASNKSSYLPGETVTLSGANWTPGSTVHVVVDDDKSNAWTHTADVAASAGGAITDSFALPAGLVANFTVTATGLVGQSASSTFNTLAAQPTITSDKSSYLPGETVALAGANWTPGSTVHVVVDDDKSNAWTHTADVVATTGGTITDSFALPTSFVATFTATATGVGGQTATTIFSDAYSGSRVGYIVTFRPGTSSVDAQAALAQTSAHVDAQVGPLRMYMVTFASEAAQRDVTTLTANSSVERVEADKKRDVAGTPNDPQYGDQWSLPKIGWDQAYGVVNPGGSAKVAVLDTGINASHPDLAGNVVAGTSILDGSNGESDPNGHGTAMAGIVAARTGNGAGIAGVGYAGVKVMPVTVLAADGTGTDSDVIQGVVWAAENGADVHPDGVLEPGLLALAAGGARLRVGSRRSARCGDGERRIVDGELSGGRPRCHGRLRDRFLRRRLLRQQYGSGRLHRRTGRQHRHDVGRRRLRLGDGNVRRSGRGGGRGGADQGELGRVERRDRLAAGANADPAGSQSQTGNGRLHLGRALNDTSTAAIQPAGADPVGSGPIRRAVRRCRSIARDVPRSRVHHSAGDVRARRHCLRARHGRH